MNGGGELRRRLLDMGLTPNTIVKLVRVAPLGDPIELCLRGYNLSLREEAARDIEVELLSLDIGSCGRVCHHGFGTCIDCTATGMVAADDASNRHHSEKCAAGDLSDHTHIGKARKRRRWQRNR